MKRMFAAVFLTLTLAMLAGFSGCATPTTTGASALASLATPESQIAAGANAETTAITLATVLLKNGKITVTQAKSYSGMLHAASTALDDANNTLVACRKTTGSTAATNPDPCSIGVVEVISLAVSSIASIQKTLAAK